tara:strand:- start:61381 stop:62565 length:1185 start_codon:yes stop_codon:yes gene_type:complete
MEILKIKESIFNKLIYLTLIFVSIFLVFYISPLTSGDTLHYDRQSDLLLKVGFIDYFKILLSTEFDKPFLLYLGTISYTALFKLIFKDLWQHFFITGNLILSFYIFYNLFKNFNDLVLAKLFFTFLFLFNIAQNVWNFYILGDTLYYFIISLIFFKILKNLSTNTPLTKDIIVIFVLSIFAIFTRPSGLFIIGFLIMLCIFLYIFEKKNNNSILNYIFIFIFFSFVTFAIFISIIAEKNFIFFESEFFSRIYEITTTGVVVDTDKLDKLYIIDMGNNGVLDYLYFFIFKFFYIFKFWTPYWSFTHNLVNFFIYIPLYLSFFYSVINFKNFSQVEKKKIILCVTLISSIAMFITLTILDYSFRLRLAIYCPMYFLLILNLNQIKAKIRNRFINFF